MFENFKFHIKTWNQFIGFTSVAVKIQFQRITSEQTCRFLEYSNYTNTQKTNNFINFLLPPDITFQINKTSKNIMVA